MSLGTGTLGRMSDVTSLLDAAAAGDSAAADQLLPLVYEELRRLAADRMAQESTGQTLQATALVHEAYLRLVGADPNRPWNSRGHFFAAAAEAMRRILIERARRQATLKHGGAGRRVALDLAEPATFEPSDELLALNEALEKLATIDPTKAALVTMRYFAGLTMEEAAAALGMSLATANRAWRYARAWLHQEIVRGSDRNRPES
jgi:RNA polymerase sigma factor (TIGR02999 family)